MSNRIPIGPFAQSNARLAHHVLHALSNGRRARHAWRLNARRLEQAWHHGGLPNKEVVCSLDDRTPAGKRAYHATRVQIGHQLACSRQQRVHIACVGLRVARLAHGSRRGDHGVAVDRARDDYALGHWRGHGVERHERARLLVQHHDVALAPGHLELLGARHMRDVRCTVARGVDQIAAAHIADRRHQRKARSPVGSLAAGNLNCFHRSRPNKRHTVGDGVLQRGNGDLKGIDKASGGTPQRARRLGTCARFQLVDALGADNRQLGHAVGQAILAQLL